MVSDKIIDLAKRVKERQEQAIEERSDKGGIRELGILFGQATAIIHGIVIPDPTDKEIGQIKDLVERYGPKEAKWMMLKAVKHWKELYAEPSLKNVLSPTPVFITLYTFRDKIYSFLKHYYKIEEKKVEPIQKIREMIKPIERPKPQQMSLLDRVNQEREKVRKEKENGKHME